MDIPALCRQVVDWSTDRKIENFPGGGKLLRNGPASIAFVPEDDLDCVIKVIKSGLTPHGASTEEEFEWLQKLQILGGELFVTPTPISCGSNPDYIAMRRLNNNFDAIAWNKEVKVGAEVTARIGTALGEFAGLLFLKHQAIHTDIWPNNYTDELNGKIGVIDIASIEKTGVPEKMFLTPLLGPINVCPAMASKFEEVTERPIDFDLVAQLSTERLPGLLASHPPKVAADIRTRHDANLEAWKNAIDKDSACHRPASTRRTANPRNAL